MKIIRLLPSTIGIFVIIIFMSACGPIQEKLHTQATMTAVSEIATQIAEAPTITTEVTKNLVYADTENIATQIAESPIITTEVTLNLNFANVDENPTSLDVYSPIQVGPWPVVVVVHGYQQNRFAVEDLSQAIASQGAVVYNADLAFKVPFLSGINRLACAVRFARATAADYGGDPNRITIVGHSAGGASGVVVGLAGDDFTEDCVMSDMSAIPDALVAYEGPYEFVTKTYGGNVFHSILKQKSPELLDAIDPYSHIGRNPDLQVRLIHGDDRDTAWYEVLLEESINFYNTLANAGYDVELIVVNGAFHTAPTNRYTDAFALMVHQVMEIANISSH